jgi:hypothetical protein
MASLALRTVVFHSNVRVSTRQLLVDEPNQIITDLVESPAYFSTPKTTSILMYRWIWTSHRLPRRLLGIVGRK